MYQAQIKKIHSGQLNHVRKLQGKNTSSPNKSASVNFEQAAAVKFTVGCHAKSRTRCRDSMSRNIPTFRDFSRRKCFPMFQKSSRTLREFVFRDNAQIGKLLFDKNFSETPINYGKTEIFRDSRKCSGVGKICQGRENTDSTTVSRIFTGIP